MKEKDFSKFISELDTKYTFCYVYVTFKKEKHLLDGIFLPSELIKLKRIVNFPIILNYIGESSGKVCTIDLCVLSTKKKMNIEEFFDCISSTMEYRM